MNKFRILLLKTIIITLFLGTIVSLRANAQQRRMPGVRPPRETLVSPEILPDKRVIFRISAPKASDVTVTGDFGRGTLTKGDKGVWSVTVGPLVPDVYTYSFRVDGVKVTDPVNPGIKEGTRGSASMFLVPGKEAEFLDVKPIPHGTVSIVWYQSSSLGILRSMRVYTPPGYESSNKQRYPVFYLLHGGGDNDIGWSTIGRAGFIIDNLLAEGKVVPMIVVMPNGSLRNWSVPAGAAYSQITGGFEDDMIKDIIPYVEKNYRVLADKNQRAIAGLSMGGGQTLRITLDNPEVFSYIGVFSSGARNIDQEFEKKVENLKTHEPKLYWVGCGIEDKGAYERSNDLVELLKKCEIKYIFRESSGGHTWINWRHYLAEISTLLFK